MAECAHDRKYSEKHDSFYCSKCLEWLEKKCGDPNCEFCRERPDRPEHG